MKTISIVSPCYNEEKNINVLYLKIIQAISSLNDYVFEIIFIDNNSNDSTVEEIKKIIKLDKRVKLIINTRNFGHIRSPYWGIMQANGDAVVYLASDLQDDPMHIIDFIRQWENGWLVVMATKLESELNWFNKKIRESYYSFLNKISDFTIIKNATGFGLYDRKIIEIVRTINDKEPFFRGIVAELGYPIYQLKTTQKKRGHGLSKNNLYMLYDYALLGIISCTIKPIRIISIIGFLTSLITFIIGSFYLIKKIIFWEEYTLGISPIMMPILFLFGLQFIFLGIIGEYLRVIIIHARNRPIVVEKERINFD